MNKLLRTYLTCVLTTMFFLQVLQTFAQSAGGVTGRVTDSQTGEALPGATVRLAGTSTGAVTDLYGDYLLSIPEGKQTLEISFLGYAIKQMEVDVEVGTLVELNVGLEPDVLTMQEIVITSQMVGQMAAINQQINSNTIVNVVSKDRIQSLPDQNAAESVGRLPGISIQRDGGEGQKVVVRGLSPRFNNITYNGERLPSTDAVDRSVDLSFLSPEQLEGIEVYKSLRPDMDGDAVGGSINFSPKRASSGLQVDARAQYGYNSVVEEFGQYRGSFSVSNRFMNDKLGVLGTGNYQRADRTSETLSNFYDLRDIDISSFQLFQSSTELNEVIRQRFGGSLAIDYRFSPSSNILLNLSLNQRLDDELRRRRTFDIEQSRTNYDIRDQEEETLVTSNFISGEHVLFDKSWTLDWRTSFSRSQIETPYSFFLGFREESAFDAVPGNIDPNEARGIIEGLARNDFDGAFLRQGGARLRADETIEEIYTANFDLKKSLQLGGAFSGNIKIGGKHRFFDRSRDAVEFRDNGNGPFNGRARLISQFPDEYTRSTASPNEIGMTDFIERRESPSDFLDGDVDFGPVLSQNEANRFASLFADDFLARRDLIDNQDYVAEESISAGYIMAEANSPKFTVLGGVRLEYFNGDYTGFETSTASADDEEDQQGEVALIERTNNVWYAELLPMLNLKYKVNDWFDIRAAVTKSLARPNYQNLVPWRSLQAFESIVSEGNPNLQHMTSWNYDIFFSVYNKFGLFTVGAFYKELDNIDVQSTSVIRDLNSNFNGFTLNTPINTTGISTIRGIELDAQVNLRSLPAPFDGIVLNMNGTFLETDTEYPVAADLGDTGDPFYNALSAVVPRDGRIPGQPSFVANFSLGYEKKGFSGRISLITQDDIFTDLGNREEFDNFSQFFTRIDATVSQKFKDNFQVYFNFNNITNQEDLEDQFNVESLRENYGFTMDLGLRYTFNK